LNENKKVPAPLRLAPGKLFFGFPVVPYKGKETEGGGASSSTPVGYFHFLDKFLRLSLVRG
jgi:hypothetical protein